MKIGIIGASLSGLIAGEKLAKAGHDVTIIEKKRSLGGRLATQMLNGHLFDYGVPFLSPDNRVFDDFIQEQVEAGRLYQWSEEFQFFDGTQRHKMNPNRTKNQYFASRKGLRSVVEPLKRWVDIKSEEQAGGLTYIGADRSKKRAWMINLTNRSVFECDAVILATPAPQAHGILLTAQDETPARRIIRYVDEVQYAPRHVVMASYDEQEQPRWQGIECSGPMVRWIGNESSKFGTAQGNNLIIHSSATFSAQNAKADEEHLTQALFEKAADITGLQWINRPTQTALYFWKYYSCINPIEENFMELEMKGAPLALVGDYFKGNMAGASYLSGTKLADYWINKYADSPAIASS